MSLHIYDVINKQLPDDLKDEARKSMKVPQFGPYHNEGCLMVSHIKDVLCALNDATNGVFHEDVPSPIQAILTMAARAFEHHAPVYVVLHDLDKGNCLTLVYQDGTKKAITWDQWEAMLAEDEGTSVEINAGIYAAMTSFCESRGITQISYYQQTPEGTRTHGKVTAERLRGRTDICPLVVKAIETHEVAFQFSAKGGINLPLFEKTFGAWSAEEVAFALLVNYADQMGSLGADLKPDISDFLLLAETYMASKGFELLGLQLAGDEVFDEHRLDKAKVAKALESLWKSDKAFQDENVDQAFERIVRDCKIPTYDADKLRSELGVFVASGSIDDQVADQLAGALMTTGLVPSDIGKRLGKANKDVRTAIARAVVAEK